MTEFEDKKAYVRGMNIYFYDKKKKRFIDEWGRKVSLLSTGSLVRKPEYDRYSDYAFALHEQQKAKLPEEKAFLKVYIRGRKPTYGIMHKGIIYCPYEHYDPKFFLYEEINPTVEQQKALIEMYELKVKYIRRMGKDVNIDRCTPSPEMKVAEANVIKSFGILKDWEFKKIFKSELPESLLKEMEDKGYDISIAPTSLCDSHDEEDIIIERVVEFPEMVKGMNVKYDEINDIFRFTCQTKDEIDVASWYFDEYSRTLSVRGRPEQKIGVNPGNGDMYLVETYVLGPEELTEAEAKNLAYEFAK